MSTELGTVTTGGRWVSPGPNCKSTEPYKALPRGWGIGCNTCQVYSEKNYKTQAEAKAWFRLHKADAVVTWPRVFIEAIDNLKAGGLLCLTAMLKL